MEKAMCRLWCNGHADSLEKQASHVPAGGLPFTNFSVHSFRRPAWSRQFIPEGSNVVPFWVPYRGF